MLNETICNELLGQKSWHNFLAIQSYVATMLEPSVALKIYVANCSL